MAKRPDMQAVGAKIAHLRREKGLCAAAFAREIDQPFWLVMLLESAHTAQAKELIDLLPDSVIEELLREIYAVYGVSRRWLTARYQSPKHPPVAEAAPLPEPLLLPIVIMPEDAVSLLDDMMALTLPDHRVLLRNEVYFRQRIKSVALLYRLQLAWLRHNGYAEEADQKSQQFKQLLTQWVAHWRERFDVTDLDLNESTGT